MCSTEPMFAATRWSALGKLSRCPVRGGEACIKSQIHEGWKLVRTHCDGGGLSGRNLERSALQLLLADTRVRKIDAFVTAGSLARRGSSKCPDPPRACFCRRAGVCHDANGVRHDWGRG